MSNTATRRLALAVPLLLSSMGCSDSDDSPSGGGRPPLPQAKAYPIVHYDRHAASDIQDQFVVASLTLDTGLLVLDMGPHNCDIARSNVKLTDVEMNRGRSLFSEQKMEA